MRKSDQVAEETVATDTDESAAEAQQDLSADLENVDTVEDAEIIEESESGDADASDVDESVPDDITPEPLVDSTPPESVAVRRNGGFVPLVFGGLVAGGIGFAVATWMNSQDTGPDLEGLLQDQAAKIEALTARVDGLPPAPDLTGIESSFQDVQAATAAQLSDLQTSLDENLTALNDRLTEVEKRPGSDGTLSDTALEAYQNELDDLRAQLEVQSDGVAAMAAQAEADLEAARAQAEEAQIEALIAARTANARAALNRIAVAVDAGEVFTDQLPDVEVVLDELPQILTDAAETGVASVATLQDEFAPAARAALAAARAEGVAEEGGGIGGFLRSQFDVRSTAPREGNDPDAILSRAEAALNEGRLSDALAEIASLPEVARAEMTDWTAKAQLRADVLSTITTLSENLNEN